MAEPNLAPDQERYVESHAPYLKVFWSLLVLTILEYGFAKYFESRLAFAALVAGLMVLAVTKAFLVGWYFMHLKFEGRWVYLMLVPVCLLAVVVITGLAPDIAYHQSGFFESTAVADH
jgi:cytochrome c oxidase subunit IV